MKIRFSVLVIIMWNKLGLTWATPEFSSGFVCQNRIGMKIGVKMKIMIGHGMEIGIMKFPNDTKEICF